ncbi:MAG: hypothetical protein ABWX61_04860 [Paenisporosarcina sp.]
MAIYYFLCEAVPHIDNPEKNEFEGAYINCWVDSNDIDLATQQGINMINNEGWELISIETQFQATRDQYEGDPELEEALACFDQAVKEGAATLFYTWPHG